MPKINISYSTTPKTIIIVTNENGDILEISDKMRIPRITEFPQAPKIYFKILFINGSTYGSVSKNIN